ncbi:hypothetical protein DUZ99_15545 [Xylanibacillus composti]|uniref:TlpA family protein disulfide reductase n=1 Tax=Xylanibacillus composti TaxID=1572762 RepID=UPI001BCD131E|nr:hypothetical protein [Xylanibacillus composti]MDT9726397.1 hypothetical protein [Xylanibacillus composti]
MSLPDFRKLLNRDGKLTREPVSLQEGDTFPPVADPAVAYAEFRESGTTLFVFISMTCAACMALLPVLKDWAGRGKGSAVLMMNGYPEEREEIVKHFAFPFPVMLVEEQEMRDKYRIPFTPYAYQVEASGLIVKHGEVKLFLAGGQG